jgi:uncharacterized protein YkuJ
MMSRDSRGNRDRSGDRDHYDSITGRDRDGNDRDHGGDNDFDHGYERDRDQVRFTLNGDKVTNVQEYDDGVWQAERLEKGETWTFDGINLIHQEREHGGLQTSTYTDSDGDGIFTAITGSSDTFGL